MKLLSFLARLEITSRQVSTYTRRTLWNASFTFTIRMATISTGGFQVVLLLFSGILKNLKPFRHFPNFSNALLDIIWNPLLLISIIRAGFTYSSRQPSIWNWKRNNKTRNSIVQACNTICRAGSSHSKGHRRKPGPSIWWFAKHVVRDAALRCSMR